MAKNKTFTVELTEEEFYALLDGMKKVDEVSEETIDVVKKITKASCSAQ